MTDIIKVFAALVHDYCIDGGVDGVPICGAEEGVRAALAELEKEHGYVLVPISETSEMLSAGYAIGSADDLSLSDVWEAMVSARPKEPAGMA